MSIRSIVITFIILFTGFTSNVSAGFFSGDSNDCSVVSKLNNDSFLRTINMDAITLSAYCTCGEKIDKDQDEIQNEDDIMQWKNDDMAQCVSGEEKRILLKKELLKEEEGLGLSWSQGNKLLELKSGLLCGRQSLQEEVFAVMCVKDIRLYNYDNNKRYSVPFLGSSVVFMKGLLAGIGNWFIFLISGLIDLSSSVGYSSFDKLPPLLLDSTSDVLNKDTLIGVINIISLITLGFLIIFFIFNKGVGKESESYIKFFIRAFITLFLIMGFPVFYYFLNDFLEGFGKILIDGASAFSSDALISTLDMGSFLPDGFTTLTILGFIAGIPNLILLLSASVFILFRNIALMIIGVLSPLLAVGFLAGSLKKENIFEGGDSISKGFKVLIRAGIWSYSFFFTVVLTVMLFKIIIVILGIIPSFDASISSLFGQKMSGSIIDNIKFLGVDALIYLGILNIIVRFWYKYLFPVVFSITEGAFITVFFPSSLDAFGGHKNFTREISNAYTSTKASGELLREKFPNALNGVVGKQIDGVSNKLESLKGKAMAFTSNNTSDVLTKSQRIKREAFSVAKKVLTPDVASVGMGTMSGITEGETKFRARESIKGVENKNERISELKEEKAELDDIDDFNKIIHIDKQIEILNREKISNEKTIEDYKKERIEKRLNSAPKINVPKKIIKEKTEEEIEEKSVKIISPKKEISEEFEIQIPDDLSHDSGNDILEQTDILDKNSKKKKGDFIEPLDIKIENYREEDIKTPSFVTKKSTENLNPVPVFKFNHNKLVDSPNMKQEKNISDIKERGEFKITPEENNVIKNKKEEKKVIKNSISDIKLNQDIYNNVDLKNKDDISDFKEKYAIYSQNGDSDNMNIFGSNKIALDLITKKFNIDSNIDGIGSYIDKIFDKLK